jgi:superfamily II DNA or RNA helicase
MFVPRPYQSEAIDAARRSLVDHRSVLLTLATGLGKTVIFSEVSRLSLERRPDLRVMVIAHRDELIRQAAAKLEAATGEHVGIEMAEDWAASAGILGPDKVVVSSVQTLNAKFQGGLRMERFNPDEFGLLVIDEAHHATATTYRRVIDHFQQHERLVTLGVTATPRRADKAAMGRVFDSAPYVYGIAPAVRDGWLVPVRQQVVDVQSIDLSNVRTTGGDLNRAELAEVLEEEESLHGVAKATVELAGDRPTLIFAATVKQAQRLAWIIGRYRGDDDIAAHVSGKTPKDERRRIFEALNRGEIQYLANVGVATEGFDEPQIGCVVMARPTKSEPLYTQCLGRGTRPLPGLVDRPELADDPAGRRAAIAASDKPDLLVLDFEGNAGRHKLVMAADVLGGDYSEAAVESAKAMAKDRPAEDITSLLDEAEEEEQRRQAREKAQQAAEAREREARERERRRGVKGSVGYSHRSVDPFDALQIEAPAPTLIPSGRELTAKQRAQLVKADYDPDALTFEEGKKVLDTIFARRKAGLCTPKQANILKRFGYDTNIYFETASEIIDRIAANGWQRPDDAPAPAEREAVAA